MSRAGACALLAALIAIVLIVVGAACVAYADETATADQHARRLSNEFIATPTVPLDPRDVVNGLPYRFYDAEPAKTAWYIVTAEVLGWDTATQDAWWPFARDVMLGESGFCWNRLRGDVMAYPNDGCVQERQGTHEDAGFGQVTWVLYGEGSLLCVDLGICSKWQVISDPWTSMVSMVWVMDKLGRQPWCWNDFARGYHACHLAPR